MFGAGAGGYVALPRPNQLHCLHKDPTHTPGGFPDVLSLYARRQIIYDNRPDEGANAYYGLEGMHEGVSNADQQHAVCCV